MNTTRSIPSLRHLLLPNEADHENYGFRAFNSWEQSRDPSDNWGMDFGEIPIPPPWLQDIHNRYAGKRAFIFGTGPSLVAQLPLLGALEGKFTFTCNRMAQWKDIPFTPFVHCITEPSPVLDYGKSIIPVYDYPLAQNKVACIWWPVWAKGWLWCPKASDDIQVRWSGTFGMGETLPPVPTAWASPLTITQLALWMGFSEIFLAGVDTTQVGQAWDAEQGRTARERNIRSILECAERIGRDVKRHGRIIRDCTPGGRLNKEGALEYLALEEVLA